MILSDEQQKAKLLAEAAGMTYVPTDSDGNDNKVDDTKVDDTKVDDTKVDDTKVDDTKVDDTKVDDTKIDSSGGQKVDTDIDTDHVEDKKIIPNSDNSDAGTDQQVIFDTSLAERSKGRFKNMADIEKALDEAPASAFANEQLAKLNDYVKAGGTLNDFVNTQTVDYTTMNPIELIQAHRTMKDKDLTAKEIQIEMEEDFGIAENASDRAKTLAGIKLKREGAAALEALNAHQQKWKTPLADQSANRAANLEKWGDQLNTAVDGVENIEIALNQTDNFTFKLEPEAKAKIKSDYKDLDQFFKRYIDKDGNEDTARFVRDMVFLDNREAIVRAAASGSKSQGKKDVIGDIKNTDFEAKDKKGKETGALTIAQQAAKAFYGN